MYNLRKRILLLTCLFVSCCGIISRNIIINHSADKGEHLIMDTFLNNLATIATIGGFISVIIAQIIYYKKDSAQMNDIKNVVDKIADSLPHRTENIKEVLKQDNEKLENRMEQIKDSITDKATTLNDSHIKMSDDLSYIRRQIEHTQDHSNLVQQQGLNSADAILIIRQMEDRLSIDEQIILS